MEWEERQRWAEPPPSGGSASLLEVNMASVASSGETSQPGLVFFHSSLSGHCRRVEGFLAQVLQRRRNHGTFKLYRVEQNSRPDLVERFGIETMPTLVVVEGKTVRAKLERPRGCRDIERFLAPWLN
jgi:thioredoxin-like negative regulator of GroEL